MVTFGLDVSDNDHGLSLASSQRAGFEFVTARALSFPKGLLTVDADYANFRDTARALSMAFAAYVLFHTYYTPDDQAAALARSIGDPRIPVMIDLEPDSDTPSIQFAAACFDACKAHGLNPQTLYDPHWYWTEQAGPPLNIRPWRLVSSAYGDNAPGAHESLYQARGGDTSNGWSPYGSLAPVLWQFGSKVVLGTDAAGQTHYGDADAFRGSLAELVSLGMFIGDPMTAPTLDDIVTALRGVLNEGTAPGTTGWAATCKGTLSGLQHLTNVIAANQAALVSELTALAGVVAELQAELSQLVTAQGPISWTGELTLAPKPPA